MRLARYLLRQLFRNSVIQLVSLGLQLLYLPPQYFALQVHRERSRMLIFLTLFEQPLETIPAESNPHFKVLTFTDADCNGVYVSPCQEQGEKRMPGESFWSCKLGIVLEGILSVVLILLWFIERVQYSSTLGTDTQRNNIIKKIKSASNRFISNTYCQFSRQRET